MLRNIIFTIFLLLLSNKIFSQEMCENWVEDVFGNPYESSERDAFPISQSLAFLSELECITNNDEEKINFFNKKSDELMSKYISLGSPYHKNKEPRYCLKTYPFTNAEEIGNFEKYEDCESKRLVRLDFQHSDELRMLFFLLIK